MPLLSLEGAAQTGSAAGQQTAAPVLDVMRGDAQVHFLRRRDAQEPIDVVVISDALLPAGSDVGFREVGVWGRYKAYILGTMAIVVLQTVLMTALVFQRARRRPAELAVREGASALRRSFEQNQDLAGRLINAQEKERRRIGRDLHDDLSQQLAGVAIMLSSLKRKLGIPDLASEIEQMVTTLQHRTAAAAETVRTLSHELHPGVLEHAGLVAALRGHCAEVEAHHEIKVAFSDGGIAPETVSPDVALCLFRVTQEALNNALRHARARTILVRLTATIEHVELSIIDDGVGFAPVERGRSGLGLRSIDERVRLNQGTVKVESRIGQGTTLWVVIPRLATERGHVLSRSSFLQQIDPDHTLAGLSARDRLLGFVEEVRFDSSVSQFTRPIARGASTDL